MTGRTVKEWQGKTPDSAIPPRVQLRVLERSGNRCVECSRLLGPAGEKFALDHIRALINGGAHAESNLQALCLTCHAVKSRADVAEKSRVYRKRAKNAGIKPKSRRSLSPPPGSVYDWGKRKYVFHQEETDQ